MDVRTGSMKLANTPVQNVALLDVQKFHFSQVMVALSKSFTLF